MAALDMNMSIDDSKVIYSRISKSKNGYNYASMYCKMRDGEYMNVEYEWEGEAIPEFAMSLASFMTTSKNTATASVNYELTDEVRQIMQRKISHLNDLGVVGV